jgi:outer membrane lipoprotein carrier protein
MRWEYQLPDRQILISDGVQLWIYRPEDRQVMIGKAPDYFSDGKGASFLSDMRVLRLNFSVSLEPETDPRHYRLKLVPKKRTADLAHIVLEVRKDDFTIGTVTTTNAYEDETRIELNGIQANAALAESLFAFDVPPGTEILKLE